MNRILWSVSAALAGGALLCAAVGVLTPVDVETDVAEGSRRGTPATTQTSPDVQLPLEAFEPIWALNLRKPVTDAPAITTAAVAPPPDPANVNPGGAPFVLVGTIGDTLAMIRTPAGGVEVRAVGEQAHGAKILAVRPAEIDVELAGARVTLTKPKEPG